MLTSRNSADEKRYSFMILNGKRREMTVIQPDSISGGFYSCDIDAPQFERHIFEQGYHIKKKGLVEVVESAGPKFSGGESIMSDTWISFGFNHPAFMGKGEYESFMKQKAGMIWAGITMPGDAVMVNIFPYRKEIVDKKGILFKLANRILDKVVKYAEDGSNYDLKKMTFEQEF